ncbi:MAG: CbiQ family ECF transporter T component [Candidatus Korarchaeota archaeon]|nr:hypothetical protein [Thermoproteota archaeon]MCR8463205.1 hypothetical protein [Thermoproteota archaeon]MCR8470864.1 hypothetical protein [Thermoproteota archaeon]
MDLIHKTLKTAANYFENFFIQENVKSFLVHVDPRIKLPTIASLIIAVTLSTDLRQLFVLMAGFLLIYLLSGVSLRLYLKKVYLLTLFSLLIVLPHAFLSSVYYVVAFALKVYISLSLLILFSLTTSLRDLLSTLKFYRVPDTIISTIALTCIQLFTLFKELSRMLLARESRRIPGKRDKSCREVWKKGSFEILGPFFLRVYERSEMISLAMISRGFSGKFVPMRVVSRRLNTGLFLVSALCIMILWILAGSSFLLKI